MKGYLVPEPHRISPKSSVEANTGDATLTVANFGKIQTNTAAAGAVVLTLPAASTVAGCGLKVQLTAAQDVTLTPPSGGKIYLGGSGVANESCIIAGLIGAFADVFCDGVDFSVLRYSGVLTKA